LAQVATLQEMSLAQPKGMAEELMQVQCYTSVSEFMRDAEPIFADREAEHSVMIGVLGNLQKDMNFYNVEPELLALRSGSGSPVLVACMVHPFPLVLSLTAPETSEDVQGALKCLAGYVGSVLIEKRLFPVKIVGHPDLVDFLSAQLCGSGCPRLKPGLRMQFFRLNPDALQEPRLRLEDDPSLTARRYEPERDAGWIRQWVHQFHVDAMGYAQDHMVENHLSELARLPTEARGMFLLFKGDEFVSYAGYGGATANTMRVTGVFTAPDFRGRGYGQLACWYACRYLLTPVEAKGLGRTALVIAANASKSSVMGIYKRLGFAETTQFQEYVDEACAS